MFRQSTFACLGEMGHPAGREKRVSPWSHRRWLTQYLRPQAGAGVGFRWWPKRRQTPASPFVTFDRPLGKQPWAPFGRLVAGIVMAPIRGPT